MQARALALGVLLASQAVVADDLTAPPLVSAPFEAEPPPPPPRPPPETMPRVANPPLDPAEADDPNEPGAPRVTARAAPDEPPGRMKRVGLSLAFGAVSGATLGLIGGAIGASLGPGQLQPMGNGWSLAAAHVQHATPAGYAVHDSRSAVVPGRAPRRAS